MFGIVLLVPVSAKYRNYKNVNDCDLVSILLSSFVSTSELESYLFSFLLGYDSDDKFYKDENIQCEIQQKFPELNLYFTEIPDDKKTLCQKRNHLFKIALTDPDNYFFFQVGDDVCFSSKNWEYQLIKALSNTNFYGMVYPFDGNSPELATTHFVSRKHDRVFHTFFPENLGDSFLICWILNVYSKGFLHNCRNVEIKNTSRCGPPLVADWIRYKECFVKDREIFFQYLKNLVKLKYECISFEPNVVMTNFFREYTKSVKFGYELVFESNLPLLGFKELFPIAGNTPEKSLSDLCVSDINTFKFKAYRFFDFPLKKSKSSCMLICIKNPTYYEGFEKILERQKEKWNIEQIFLYSSFDYQNIEHITTDKLIEVLSTVDSVIYDIYNPFVYELCIKYKIHNVLELKPRFFNLIEYSQYYYPLSFDNSLKKTYPLVIGLREGLFLPDSKKSRFRIFTQEAEEGDINFIKRIFDSESHVLYIRQPVSDIPLIDFSYIVGMDIMTNKFLFIGDKRVIDLVFQSSFPMFNLPFYLI